MERFSRSDWKPETLEMKTFHIDNRSYTKERILIYTIQVINTWDDLENLQSYFSQFGKIKEISILTKYKNPNGKSRAKAKIQFEQSESASLALRFYNESYALEDMHVTYDENSDQPYHQHLSLFDDIEENSIETFQKLNFECLNKIFSYLPQTDKIKLSLISKDFKKIFKNYFTSNKLIIDNDISLKEARSVLIQLGEYVHKLELNRNSRYDIRFFNEIITLCPNLKYLRVEEFKISEKISARELAETFHNTKNLEFICIRDRISCKNISEKMKILKNLELINCGLRNDDIKRLENLSKQIEHLDLSENPDLNGEYLEKFCNLKSLILRGCNQLNQKSFQQICINEKNLLHLKLDVGAFLNFNNEFPKYVGNMKNLIHLDIHDSTGQRQHGFEYAKEFMKELSKTNLRNNLKILKLPFQLDLSGDAIGKFINLCTLEIQNFNSQLCLANFWINLKTLNELRTLNASYNIRYDQKIFLDFIEMSKNIEKVKIVVIGAAIFENFVLKVIEIMKNKKENSKYLMIWRKSISKSDLIKLHENPDYINNKNLIKLRFDCIY